MKDELFKPVRERRRGVRFNLKTSVTLKSLDPSSEGLISGLTQDISLFGMSLFSPSVLKKNERLKLWLLHPQKKEVMQTEGEVVWVSIDDLYGDSKYWIRAGISFHNIQPNEKIFLESLLSQKESGKDTKSAEANDKKRIAFVT